MITPWIEFMLDREKIPPTRENLDRFVLGRLRHTVAYCAESSNFYKDLFKGSPSIDSIDDFENLPMTCAEDVIDKPNFFLCVSQSEILRSYVVETLDGRSKQISFSLGELEHVTGAVASFFRSIGAVEGTRVGIVFPPEYEWGIPDLLTRAARDCRADVQLIDQNDLDAQMSAIGSFQPNLIVGSAQQLFFLSALRQKAEAPSFLNGIVPCHGCVPYIFSEKAKRMVTESWGTKVYEHFGITEMGFNVAVGCGRSEWLHLNEVDVYAEIVDPTTLETLGEGQKGELLLTSLSATSMPLIRYRTGYLATMAGPGCDCGDSLTRRLKISSYLGSDEDLLSQPLVFRPF
jgi:phenylacetate-coenzyme A ligase PaaK-like adenylate-forming protein